VVVEQGKCNDARLVRRTVGALLVVLCADFLTGCGGNASSDSSSSARLDATVCSRDAETLSASQIVDCTIQGFKAHYTTIDRPFSPFKRPTYVKDLHGRTLGYVVVHVPAVPGLWAIFWGDHQRLVVFEKHVVPGTIPLRLTIDAECAGVRQATAAQWNEGRWRLYDTFKSSSTSGGARWGTVVREGRRWNIYEAGPVRRLRMPLATMEGSAGWRT